MRGGRIHGFVLGMNVIATDVGFMSGLTRFELLSNLRNIAYKVLGWHGSNKRSHCVSIADVETTC